MAEINYMDMEEFRERGYLQEANRQWFHPLGLALEWDGGWDRDRFAREMAAAGYQYGEDAMSNAWAGFQLAGGHQPRLSGVWDSRDDEEGYRYAGYPDEIVAEGLAKADAIATEQALKRVARERVLGYHIQPVSDFGN